MTKPASGRPAAAATEPSYGATGPGTVLLELGAQTGALILYTPAGLAGREIEISQDRPGARRTHACVRERRAASGSRYAAVYADLAAGDYTVWRDHATPALTVTVTGGQIAQAGWPAAG